MPSYRHVLLSATLLAGCDPATTLSAGQPDPKAPAAPKKEAANDRVVLTAGAAAKIGTFIAEDPKLKYLRLTVSDDEQIKLDLDPNTDPKDDLLGASRGITVVVDRKSAAILPLGIVVDYIEEGTTRGFKFRSPGGDRGVPDTTVSLTDARKDFKTTLRPPPKKAAKLPVADPPADLFQVIRYDASPGKFSAYLTSDPKDGKKHPAIIWITGGDCNSIDAGCWRVGAGGNDQSASAYRKAGIVMMFPALRGGNDNPGAKEGFLGEVEDVLAAAAFLRKQPYVDSDRVYLGGHSTGGTMALLTAECSDRFRAVFSFGPIDDVLGYGLSGNPFSMTDPKELQLRSPVRWLHSIRTPTFVIEGADGGNANALRSMAKATKNAKVQFFVVKGADHFDVLAPTNLLIAGKILKDSGAACDLAFTEEELTQPFKK